MIRHQKKQQEWNRIQLIKSVERIAEIQKENPDFYSGIDAEQYLSQLKETESYSSYNTNYNYNSVDTGMDGVGVALVVLFFSVITILFFTAAIGQLKSSKSDRFLGLFLLVGAIIFVLVIVAVLGM